MMGLVKSLKKMILGRRGGKEVDDQEPGARRSETRETRTTKALRHCTILNPRCGKYALRSYEFIRNKERSLDDFCASASATK